MTTRTDHLSLDNLSLRNDWANLCLLSGVLLTVYLYTMPQNIVMEDTSIFVMASHYLGTAHPPGYPLVVLTGKLFSYFPVGSPAFRIHLVSVFFAVLTCSALYLTARLLSISRLAATTGAIALGLSRAFWSQAIIAEAYTLNTFLFCLLFATCLIIRATRDAKWIPVLCFIYGLSLANHWPLIQMTLPALLIVLWPCRRLFRTHVLKSALCFLCGLSPYVLMVVLSQRSDAHSFAGPITSLQDFAFFVSRQMYVGVDSSSSATWQDKILFLKFYAIESGAQFTLIGAILAGFGVMRFRELSSRSLFAASVLIFLSQTVLIILLLNFDFEPINQSVIVVYPLIAYVIMALWVANGFHFLFNRLSKKSSMWSVCNAVIAASFLFALYQINIEDNDRHQDLWAVNYAKTVLHSLPENAVLFTHGDLDAGPLEYLHQIEGVRRDITLVNDQGLGFSDKPFSPLQKPRSRKLLREFIDKQSQPVFYTNEYFPNPYHAGRFGFLFSVVKNPDLTPKTIAVPDHLGLLSNSAQLRYRDTWIDAHIELLMAFMCSTLTHLAYEAPRPDAEHTALLETCAQSFLVRLYRMRDLIDLDPENGELIGSSLVELNRLETQEPSKQVRSWFHVLKGNHMANQGRNDGAMSHYQDAIEIYPDHTNEALFPLLSHYAAVGALEEFADLKNRFYEGRRPPRRVKKLEELLRSKTPAKPSDLN